MALINSYFFDSNNGDRKYSAQDFAKAFGIILKDGVIIGSEPTFDTANKSISPFKATVQGHFIEVTDNYSFYVSGTYEGMVILRVDPITAREATLAIRQDRTPTQLTDGLYEYPLFNISVSNGSITSAVSVFDYGGSPTAQQGDLVTFEEMNNAIDNALANAVKFYADPNGVYLNAGTNNGKTYKIFLTSAQPSATPSNERRTWIQQDA